MPSQRWGDPRTQLLTLDAWQAQRTAVCRMLRRVGKSAGGSTGELTGAAWRHAPTAYLIGTQCLPAARRLARVSPLVWRRLLVRSDSAIADLHVVLQVALGWTDEHLNRFVIHGREYGISHVGGLGFRDDPRQVRLVNLGLRIGERFLYEYDFTDGWQHDVRVEQILPPDPRRDYPVCIGGRRQVPPEDCGGPWAFHELRQRHSLVDSAERLMELVELRAAIGGEAFVHDHYEDVMQVMFWLGTDRFDRRGVNRQLAERVVGAQLVCTA